MLNAYIMPKHKIASSSLRAVCNDPTWSRSIFVFFEYVQHELCMFIQVYNLNAIVFELLLAPASAALAPSWQQVPLTVPGPPRRPHQSKTFNRNRVGQVNTPVRG